jgi:hypothetical protein
MESANRNNISFRGGKIMARIFEASKEAKATLSRSTAQLFFSGGHGGLVTYDGNGGQMIKEGGPMDRVFLLLNDGRMVGDAGLDIVYGHVNFRTGVLLSDVKLQKAKGKTDSIVTFQFAANDDPNALEIKGGITELGLPRDTVLVHGTVAESTMVWETGDVSKKEAALPYAALHPAVTVHPALLKWFGFTAKSLTGTAAESGWCKLAPRVMSLKQNTDKGIGFRTQQHLGHLRVFL